MVREKSLVHVPAARRLAVGGAAVARLRPEVRAAEELLHQLEPFDVLVGAAQQLLVDLDVVLEQGGHWVLQMADAEQAADYGEKAAGGG